MVYFEWQVDPFLEERLFSPFFSHFSPLRVPKLSTEFWMRTDCATLSLCRECSICVTLLGLTIYGVYRQLFRFRQTPNFVELCREESSVYLVSLSLSYLFSLSPTKKHYNYTPVR